MALHLVKLCVGVTEVARLQNWISECAAGLDTLDHTTRMFPRRKNEILPSGSLYWVMRGMIMCRQPILDLEAVTGPDGIERCRIVFAPEIVLVRPQPRRPFQGWRYLEASDAPPDLQAGSESGDMPEDMRKELAALGLL